MKQLIINYIVIILIYIYFFPGRSLEEVEFTFNDEVHEINALIEDVNDLRRELKNIFMTGTKSYHGL